VPSISVIANVTDDHLTKVLAKFERSQFYPIPATQPNRTQALRLLGCEVERGVNGFRTTSRINLMY
jgi:hypothetical protein